MAREHNNANILCLGQRVLGDELAKMLVQSFLRAEFAGGRHARRVAKIDAAGGS
jgi:ribose 5-phosphate isomerase B